jgi:hypothetical protein
MATLKELCAEVAACPSTPSDSLVKRLLSAFLCEIGNSSISAGGQLFTESDNGSGISNTGDYTVVNSPGLGKRLRIVYLNVSNAGNIDDMVSWSDDTYLNLFRYNNVLKQGAIWAHNLTPGEWDLPENTGLSIYIDTGGGSITYTVIYQIIDA